MQEETETEAAGARRLVAAVLLLACLDAHKGDGAALAWLGSEESAAWAGLLGLDRWPPSPGMLGTRRELQARARSTFTTE
jgi:hypothetical protein